MSRPHLVTTENSNLPVLIIDREGSIGLGLYTKLKDHVQIVLVGGREPETSHNLLFLRLHEHIPTIPKDPYSHIFLIAESERDLSDLLPACLEKTKEDKAKLLILVAHEIKKEFLSTILSSDSEVIMAFVKDIFDCPVESKKQNRIERLFYQAKIKKEIKLSNMGLHTLYPIQFEDLLIELLKLAFGGKHASQIFYLFCRFSITELGLAHSLQKVNPLIKIDFTNEEKEQEHVLPEGGVYLLPESYPLFNKLYIAYSTYKTSSSKEPKKLNEPKEPMEEKIMSDKKSTQKKLVNKKSFFLFCIIFFITIAALPLIITIALAFQGKELVVQAKNILQKGNSASAQKFAIAASQTFIFAQETMQAVSWEANIVGLQDKAFTLRDTIQTGQSISLEIERIANTVDLLKNVLAGHSLRPRDDVNTVVSNFKRTLTESQTLIQNTYVPLDIRQELGKQLESTAVFANVIEGLPALLSVDGKKTYAVLFQNNMELRPGGGFIGSYGLLNMDKGKITDFTIHDVYDADGQLKGHIEPPFQIRRYLPKEHWYLRDSNFDVDTLKNASQVAFFLQLETGQQIDGVIGVDLSFVKSIIQAMGSVTVPEYTETVTPDNFFLLTENHAEKNFFPGSSQKKDFLRSLFAAIQNKIAIGNISYAKFISQAAIAAKEKHILFAFADKQSQDLFTVNGLSSSLWDPRVQTDGTVNDFLGINEANLGVNKVNYYIDRSVDQRVVINDIGDVSEQVTLTYINKSKDYKWPGGDYKNYLRFIVPQNTSLVKVMFDGQDQNIVPAVQDFKSYEAKGFVPPAGLEVARQNEQGKTLYGFLITIPPNSKKTITVIYVLPQKFSVNKLVQHYNVIYDKQQGTETYPYNFSLAYPSAIKGINIPAGFLNQGTQVVYTGPITTDIFGDISLSKK